MSDRDRTSPAAQSSDGPAGSTGNPEWNKDIKAYYDAIASEPIPDEIQELMAILAKSIRK